VPQAGPACPKGHQMRSVLVSQLGMVSPCYAAGAKCDGCGRHVLPNESVSHCDSCGYDLCPSCGNRGMMPSLPASTCPKGHPMRDVFIRELGAVNKSYSSGTMCDKCRRMILADAVIRHCDVCEYDICVVCRNRMILQQQPPPMCPRGHPVREVSVQQLAAQSTGYSAGAKCDKCGRHVELNECVLHCDACGYDMCPNCWI